jgi:hypothetical protein
VLVVVEVGTVAAVELNSTSIGSPFPLYAKLDVIYTDTVLLETVMIDVL